MKNLFLFSLLLMTGQMLCAQNLPTFSTAESEKWYVIRFCRGEAALQDQGEGNPLQTADIDKKDDNQLWKIVGSQENCEIISKAGRHI